MIIEKEIRAFKKIYGKNNYGIVEWQKEQKGFIKKLNNISIKNNRERLLFKLMYEEEFQKNDNTNGKDLLLQFVIVISSIIASIIFSMIGFIGDIINGIISTGDVNQEAFWNMINSLTEEYIKNSLGLGGVVIKIIGGAFFLLLLAEVIFAFNKIMNKKDSLIKRRYYTCMVELYNEEINNREENKIIIKND